MSELPVDERLAEASRNETLTVGSFKELASPAGLKVVNAANSHVVILPHLWRRRGPSLSAVAQAIPENATPADLANPRYRADHNLVALFESSEHVIIAANATLKYLDGSTQPAVSHLIQLQNGLGLTYGQILALSGDFYGDPNQPISDLPTLEARMSKVYSNFETLAENPDSVAEANDILDNLNQEFNVVAAVIQAGQEPSAAYAALGDTLSFAWNSITYHGPVPRPCTNPDYKACWFPMGRYLNLASSNWDHFGKYALLCYQAGHQQAMQMASVAQTNEDLDQAYAVNAFADHFLTDLFSAGHLRTPRKEMYDDANTGFVASILARMMHDEDSRYGLWVSNQRGDVWVAYGDKRYRDSADYANAKIVQKCVQQSMDEIYEAAVNRAIPAVGTTPVFSYIPNLDVDWTDPRNFAPLFNYVADYWSPNDGQVFRRTDDSARQTQLCLCPVKTGGAPEHLLEWIHLLWYLGI